MVFRISFCSLSFPFFWTLVLSGKLCLYLYFVIPHFLWKVLSILIASSRPTFISQEYLLDFHPWLCHEHLKPNLLKTRISTNLPSFVRSLLVQKVASYPSHPVAQSWFQLPLHTLSNNCPFACIVNNFWIYPLLLSLAEFRNRLLLFYPGLIS
jgi:hypothetical protein